MLDSTKNNYVTEIKWWKIIIKDYGILQKSIFEILL